MVSSERWLWVFRAGLGFLLLAALLFLLGFATDHWHDNDDIHYGLWRSCDGASCRTMEIDELPAYHIGTQAFQCIAVLFFGLSPIVHFVFYCKKRKKDTGWRSRILDVGYSSGIVFHLCSVLIFGLENSTPEHFSWSYKMSCASCAIAFFGIIMVIISRSKALYKFTFRPVRRSKRKTAAVGVTTERKLSHISSNTNSFHPDKIIITSTTEQGHSVVQDHERTVNINININNNPSKNVDQSSSAVHSEQMQYYNPSPLASSSYMQAQSRETTSNLHPSSSQYQHAPHSFSHEPEYDATGHYLTQVRPAPKSSMSHYSSPTHKIKFGQNDINEQFEPKESQPSLNSFATPSAPPYEAVIEGDSQMPPSYKESVSINQSLNDK